MKIQLVASTRPPLFRFSGEGDEPIRLTEIRITEVGETEPSWCLVHRDEWLDEAVAMSILTAEEAAHAGVPVTRSIDGFDAGAAPVGLPVADLTYGQVPTGFLQHGSLLELKPNHLYQLVATGTTVGEFEFYG